MRIAGFFLMVTGWLIAIAAALLLHASAPRGVFSGTALLIEALGLGIIAKTYIHSKGERFD